MKVLTMEGELFDIAYPFKTPHNAHQFPAVYEVNTQPSLTIPDQTMTVKEIMERFAKGLDATGEKVPSYNGDLDLPDLDKMDLSERYAWLEENRYRIQDMEDRLRNPDKYKEPEDIDFEEEEPKTTKEKVEEDNKRRQLENQKKSAPRKAQDKSEDTE